MYNNDVIDAKQAVRRRILAARDALDPVERAARSAVVCQKLQRQVQQLLAVDHGVHTDKPYTILAYLPYRSEIDIVPFLRWCWTQARIQTAVPRTIPQDRDMVFHRIESLSDTLEAPPYGIREPHRSLPTIEDPSQIDMMIVPGAAFDERGGRLGYGGGYYDRYLASICEQIGQLPVLIAPCFDLQVIDHIPTDNHDIEINIILTELREIA